jgi:hypothetical protein
MLLIHGNSFKLLGASASAPPPAVTKFKRPANGDHHGDWIEAIKTGGQAGSDFAYASLLTEIPHVGNLAYRTGKKIEWDSANLKAKNCPEADRFIRREYRKGWAL